MLFLFAQGEDCVSLLEFMNPMSSLSSAVDPLALYLGSGQRLRGSRGAPPSERLIR